MRLPYVLVIISKLSLPSSIYTDTHWDFRAAQDRVRLDLCLESLCYRMQSITTFNGPSQPHPDIFLSLKMILERTRRWYMRKTCIPIVGEFATADDQAEDSPLEIIRDPHESSVAVSAGAHTQQSLPEQTSDIRMPAAATVSEAKEPEATFPATAGFAEMDGFMLDLDDTFWTSNLFDQATFSGL